MNDALRIHLSRYPVDIRPGDLVTIDDTLYRVQRRSVTPAEPDPEWEAVLPGSSEEFQADLELVPVG